MISLSGFSTLTALHLVDATEETQLSMIRNDARHSRAIDHFRENIDQVETVDDLLEDPELYGFVMRAFDLEDQIFGKAMVKAILKSNVEDSDALINRMTDSRFQDLYDEMGFGTDGEGNINTALTRWQDRMVDRYVERHFLNDTADQNATLGTALEFRRQAAEIESPFDILKDAELTEFFQTAFGLPSAMSGLDIDRQAEIISARIDLTTLKDPDVVEGLIRRYVAISDATSGVASASSGAVQLMAGAVSAASGSGAFVPITIDIEAVSAAGFSGYKLR
ncbi:DUF1217 domain-containing protein [Pseudooceanicola aestuarii]|uniref:DUF1217 domain-containing protein n=1 Tax=Pseudooceanicola aestuarii TaxID=2697319 RepID=UPI0013D5EB71|nr:DUF1217 domain-containing protein [Pseudooceanicola aestuarii]